MVRNRDIGRQHQTPIKVLSLTGQWLGGKLLDLPKTVLCVSAVDHSSRTLRRWLWGPWSHVFMCVVSFPWTTRPLPVCGRHHGVTCTEASAQSCGVTSIMALVRISFKDRVSSNFPWRLLAMEMNHRQHECVWLSGNLLLPRQHSPTLLATREWSLAAVPVPLSLCRYQVCFTDVCDFVKSLTILNKHSVNACYRWKLLNLLVSWVLASSGLGLQKS